MVRPFLLGVWAVANHKSSWLLEGSVLEVRVRCNWSGIEGNRISEMFALACWSWILVFFFFLIFLFMSLGKKPVCLFFFLSFFLWKFESAQQDSSHEFKTCKILVYTDPRIFQFKAKNVKTLSCQKKDKKPNQPAFVQCMLCSVQMSTLKMVCWWTILLMDYTCKFISALRLHYDFSDAD